MRGAEVLRELRAAHPRHDHVGYQRFNRLGAAPRHQDGLVAVAVGGPARRETVAPHGATKEHPEHGFVIDDEYVCASVHTRAANPMARKRPMSAMIRSRWRNA